MAESSTLTRQWELFQILSARRNGATVRDLVAETGVVDETIRRDLPLLAKTGFPLNEIVGEYGRKSWKLDGGPGVPSRKFNLTEVLSRYLARRFLEPMAGTHDWRVIVEQQETAKSGDAVVEQLATDPRNDFPDRKGLSRDNGFRMRQFFVACRETDCWFQVKITRSPLATTRSSPACSDQTTLPDQRLIQRRLEQLPQTSENDE